MELPVDPPGDFCTPMMNSESESDENTTIGSSKKKRVVYYDKNESVSDSFISGKFTTIQNFSKRTTLQKRMDVEKFDSAESQIFKQNKSGFCTQRPLKWLMAFEIYAETENDIRTRWRYKVDDDQKFFEAEISVWFDTTTEVLIRISLLTGIFMVEGASYRKFIDNVFPKIKLEEKSPEDIEKITDTSAEATFVHPGPPKGEDELWEKLDEHTNAIKSVEDSIVNLFRIMEETNRKHDLIAETNATAPNKNLELEIAFDKKLTVFMETYDKEASTKLKNICQAFNKKFDQMKEIVANFKISTQRQMTSKQR